MYIFQATLLVSVHGSDLQSTNFLICIIILLTILALFIKLLSCEKYSDPQNLNVKANKY